MKILLCRGNIQNAKSYPEESWEEFLLLVKDHEVKEITGILPEQEIIDLVNASDIVITIDSFLPHLIKYHKLKTKVCVLWGKSNPDIFGYPDNINLHKRRFRPDQFRWWQDVKHDPEDFVSPEVIKNAIM
jgi:ADP-heptose:LPS heptosyltransferase